MRRYTPVNAGSVEGLEIVAENEYELAQRFGVRLVQTLGGQASDIRVNGNVPTLQGVIRADQGDFVYRGRDGVVRVMPRAEFLTQYEDAGPA